MKAYNLKSKKIQIGSSGKAEIALGEDGRGRELLRAIDGWLEFPLMVIMSGTLVGMSDIVAKKAMLSLWL